ncbi:hypothetical protein CYMTET_9746 [Cymbomonas tetramitiformis]|uniref:Uncharacterized protein n=1 Tax=Cymbomonas tetramitiformis TaxID=36881 RepID=A0AAE0GQV7_9CHLO|nr:hypothetical protein CYMTET_9746 [Cymbomonas tetramitiformis]
MSSFSLLPLHAPAFIQKQPPVALRRRARGAMRTRSAARQERPCDPRSAVDATLRHIGGLAAAALLVAPGAGLAAEDLALGFFEVPRCSVEALSKAANTRASFSDFATESNPELYVNIEGCDYSGLDLSKEVLSGVKARGANFSGATFGPEASRADFRGANLSGANLISVNLYQTLFNGADLSGADLSGALATGTTFGFDTQSQTWTNLAGTIFEDTLLSSSGVKSLCLNPTLLEDDRDLLGCQ